MNSFLCSVGAVVSPALEYLVGVSLRSVPVVIVVGLLSLFFRKKAPVFQYNLWLVVLLRFLLPPAVRLPFSAGSRVAGVMEKIIVYSAGISGQVVAVSAESLSMNDILALSWAVIVLALLVFMALRGIGLFRTTRNARPASFDISPAMINDFGKTASRARIMTGSRVTVPFVSGFFRPRIFLPESASEWPREELLMVIRHEMAHVARIDQPVIVIQNIVQMLFFFNPLVWFMNYRLNLLREIICDDISLRNSPGDVWKYCRLILRNVIPAGNLDNPHSLSSSFGINGSLVRSRLLYLTRRRKDAVMYGMSKIQKSLVVAIIAISALFLFGFDSVVDEGARDGAESVSEAGTVARGERPPFHPFDTPPKPANDLVEILGSISYPDLPPGEVSAVVWVEIGSDGKVIDVGIIRSSHDESVFKPALEAIRRVEWIPASYEGVDVIATIAIPVHPGIVEVSGVEPPSVPAIPPVHAGFRSLDYFKPVGFMIETKGDPDNPDEVKYTVCDTPPKPKSDFNVKYPDSAVKEGLQGRTVVRVRVSKEGKTIETVIIESSGHKVLDDAAVESMKEVIWVPGSDKGKVVEAWVAVPVDFKLE
ncbi:MAG: TonB family protein [Candidatus Krumholzibacteria bacterium]|nr:TonB family protein [Candidatus Krumholzibacteria bacterium]